MLAWVSASRKPAPLAAAEGDLGHLLDLEEVSGHQGARRERRLIEPGVAPAWGRRPHRLGIAPQRLLRTVSPFWFSSSGPTPRRLGEGQPLNRPVTGMVPFGNGYLMVGEDGGIFNFSDRAFYGSLGFSPPAQPIVSVAVLDEG